MKRNVAKSNDSSVKSARKTTLCTDDVLIDVYNALTRDFQRFRNIGILPRISSVKEYRSIKLPPLCDTLDPMAYKCIYQLKSFFNRYTALHDVYSQEDRMEMSTQKYVSNLVHINSVPSIRSSYLQPVISRARKIIRNILGDLQVEEVFGASRFGRRASIGVPFRESYLENKMTPFMSLSQNGVQKLMSQAISSDPIMRSYLQRRLIPDAKRRGLLVNGKLNKKGLMGNNISPKRLRLSFVAKKFDKLRGVLPYPTGDTFLALGIGDIMVSRLKGAGLDLARLQAVHRYLVKRMSVHRRSVTMDLSGASDCVTRWLVRLLLPSKWWALLKKFYFGDVVLPDGRVVHTETFAGMGCGFTFPLQSLIFYSLISAVKELTSATGKVSVYGDDCIFPTPIYPYVERVFEALGLKINRDKTFVARYFRESCGEDCYRGVSVRPTQLEGTTVELSGSAGSAYLYSLLNGLLQRWKHREIPNTVEVLLRKIALHSGRILIVPPFQPDYAGFKVNDPSECVVWYLPYDMPVWHYPKGTKGVPVWLRSKPSYNEPLYMYKALRVRSNKRFVQQVYPYLWEHLRSSVNPRESAWNPYKDATDDPAILGYAFPKDGRVLTPYVAEKGPGHFIEQAVASQWERKN